MATSGAVPGHVGVVAGEHFPGRAVEAAYLYLFRQSLDDDMPTVVRSIAIGGEGIGDEDADRIKDFDVHGRSRAVAVSTGEFHAHGLVVGGGGCAEARGRRRPGWGRRALVRRVRDIRRSGDCLPRWWSKYFAGYIDR